MVKIHNPSEIYGVLNENLEHDLLHKNDFWLIFL